MNDTKNLVLLSASVCLSFTLTHTQSYLQVLSDTAGALLIFALRCICLHLNVLNTLVSFLRLLTDIFTLTLVYRPTRSLVLMLYKLPENLTLQFRFLFWHRTIKEPRFQVAA